MAKYILHINVDVDDDGAVAVKVVDQHGNIIDEGEFPDDWATLEWLARNYMLLSAEKELREKGHEVDIQL